MTLPANPRVAVVGATGAVGRVMLDLLSERRFPASEIVAVASKRSAGESLSYAGGVLEVVTIETAMQQQIDLAVLDTPDEVALEWAPRLVEHGAVVVDNSAAWRAHEDVPLVIPEINPEAARTSKGIIASPNCTTLAVVVPLAPLHKAFEVQRLVVSSYQSTSGAGRGGVDELREQVEKVGSDIEPLATGDTRGLPAAQVFAAPIAFNVVPQVGSVRDNGFTGEELKIASETRKIMGLPNLEATATCVRVPTVVGHGASVLATFASDVDAASAIRLLKEAPGVEVVDVPTPLAAAGGDPVLVGRVRGVEGDSKSLWYFAASDNLRKGAALNSVQVAELLLPN